ncbi:hypothetical protein [Rhodohalobacter sp. 614A]|uniref:hypothetical protein n=1 Tax=Rhodohalobacter sp. 614A TaxID=2908649 RepID=UPI001F46C43A|nr:hypothetical protein [Rhodohalobacter sp. 614A]
MRNIKDPLPYFDEFEKNFGPPEERPTLTERFRNALTSVVLGIALFHVFFYGAKIFVVVSIGHAFYWFKNPYFLAFLGLCALFGWFKGKKFTRWIFEEIGYLKFWN